MIDIKKITYAISRAISNGTFDWSFLKGDKGEKGDQGTSAIWDANAEVLTELEQTTGTATNRTMSQNAISGAIGITTTQAEYEEITYKTGVKYIITEDL